MWSALLFCAVNDGGNFNTHLRDKSDGSEATRRNVAPPNASSTYVLGNAVAHNRWFNRVMHDLDPREAQRQ